LHTFSGSLWKLCNSRLLSALFASKSGVAKLILQLARLENKLPIDRAEGASPVRNLYAAVLFLLLASNAFAQPAVVRSSVLPEPGLLVLLGGGLVGLANLIRRLLND